MVGSKLKTPDWIIKGYKSKEEYEQASQKAEPLATSSRSQSKGIKSEKKKKLYKLKVCPKCKSSNVNVVLGGEEGKGSRGWECKACRWKGNNVDEKEMSKEEFIAHLDKMEGK